MRALALALFVALPAHAELYRWVDPDSGSIKFSNLPPSDPGVSAEVISYGAPKPPAAAAAARGEKPAPSALTFLEGRWRELLTQFTGIGPGDMNRAGEGLRQHLEAYESVKAELDRLDPAGAARRQSESLSVFERLRQGLGAQFSPSPLKK